MVRHEKMIQYAAQCESGEIDRSDIFFPVFSGKGLRIQNDGDGQEFLKSFRKRFQMKFLEFPRNGLSESFTDHPFGLRFSRIAIPGDFQS